MAAKMDVRVSFGLIEFHFIDGSVTVQRYVRNPDGTQKQLDGTALTKAETQPLRNFLNSTEMAAASAEKWEAR